MIPFAQDVTPQVTDPATIADAASTAASAADTLTWAIEMVTTYAFPVLGALVILVIGWIVSGWVGGLVVKACTRAKLDLALSKFLGQMAKYAVLVMTLIACLQTVGIQTTSFVAVLASVGFAIGLALQGTLGHFSSGVMILVFRPFTIGEKVDAGGHTGVVQEIGLFATVMLTPENKKIIVPNGSITSASITNYSAEGTLRADVGVGVAYGTDLKRVEEICIAAAKSVPEVLDEPGVGFAFTEMAASSINFNLMPWCNTADYLTVLHKVRSEVYNRLNAEGIEIPFDQVVMHQAPTDA
ncbi:MAG: mechanosensitive ion channel family protein [Myxococcota bacterium]